MDSGFEYNMQVYRYGVNAIYNTCYTLVEMIKAAEYFA